MNLQYSLQPKYSVEVKVLQQKLNAIKYNVHGNWPTLVADGLYGGETRKAVMGFQIYRNITPATGKEVGDTTMRYINEAYSCVPMIKPASNNLTPYYDTKGLSEKYPLLKIMDYIGEFLDNLDNLIGQQSRYITDMGKTNPNVLRGAYISFATQWNPKMKDLKQLFHSNLTNKKIILDNSSQAKVNVDSVRTFSEHQQIIKSQRNISHAQQNLRVNTPKAQKASMDLLAELRRYNLLDKIDKFLKSKGISGEIKVEALKNFKMSGNIKIGAGTCLKIWNYKDIIVDVLNYNEWGTDKWKIKMIKDIYKALDAIIIGYASAVIAELIVGTVIALVGATISVGWIVVIVAIVAVIIAALIGFLLDSTEVSFSEYAVQGYKYIAEYSMMLAK